MIHLGAKQLGLDEETRREMYFTLTRKRSSKDMDHRERRLVVEHLKSRGADLGRQRSAKESAEHGKIRALWAELHARGIVRNPSTKALLAYCSRQMQGERLDALAWVPPHRCAPIIESLKGWLSRSDVVPA